MARSDRPNTKQLSFVSPFQAVSPEMAFLIPAVGFLVAPGVARSSVRGGDVPEAPPDLGRRVSLPVRSGARHLAAGQGLRDAVGTARVLGVPPPAAFPVPEADQARILRSLVEAKAREHVVGDPLGRPGVRRRGNRRAAARRA